MSDTDVHAAHAETLELGHYRRVVREETRYLIDALHALRNGSPEVTEEFLDRAVLHLSRLSNPTA